MSPRFPVRLFGPGLPGGGQAVEAAWVGGQLTLIDGERRWPVPTSALAGLRAGGFNDGHWRFSFRHERDELAVFVDAAGHDALLAGAPAALKPQLHGARGQARRTAARFRLLWAALVLFTLLPLLGLVWLGFNADRVAGWAVAAIPLEQEKQLGDLVLAQTRLQMKLQDQGPAVDLVRQIGERLVGPAGSTRLQYRWFVAEQKAINAFAAPGGVVVVFSGLIERARSPEELAGVLAHEIAHAEARHSLKAMVKNLGLRALAAALLGDLSGVLADAAASLGELKFSRDAEREADDLGVARLRQAAIDPSGLLRFFELLAEEAKVSPPALLSTHPDTEERVARLQAFLATLPAQRFVPLAVDWGAARAALAKP